MSVRAVVRDSALDIEIRGVVDATLCLSGDQHLPWSDVVGASVTTWDEVRASLGWRVAGTYWPGRVATGWYAVPGASGARQFLAVFRDRSQLVAIDTRLDRPRRVVLAVPDAGALVASIEQALERA